MTVRGEVRSLGLLATALARAEAWLLEPPEPASAVVVPDAPRPIVTVRGLAPRCGASTVARGLAAVLAMADPRGAAVVVGPLAGAGVKLGTPAAVRLAREVAALGCDGIRAVGRLCLVPPGEPVALLAAERPCPVVIEVAPSSSPDDGLAISDHAVLVASAAAEPTVATAVEASLAGAGHSAEVVVNRVEEPSPTDLPVGATVLPDARLPAQVALACRGAHGALVEPLERLAGHCRATAPV